jgi:hypothetical protein
MSGRPYRLLGISLCLAGVLFAPVSYFVLSSVPLAAMGLSAIMIGFACIALAGTRPYLSPEACQMILRTGMENTSALIEELGLRNKAIYLPAANRGGRPQALIPIGDDSQIQWAKENLPGRLIVRYGTSPNDMAIAVATPGSINVAMLETKPGPTGDEIQQAASYLLIGVLDIARAVSVSLADGQVTIEVSGARLDFEDAWYYRCLGSPIASIVAAVSSEALGKPIRIKEETFKKTKGHIVLEVLS